MVEATLQIDLKAIKANWHTLDRLSAPHVETAAVVKADAYSLGTGEVATCLRDAGVKSFFVAQSPEGATLRNCLADMSRIFVLNGHMKGDTEDLAQYRLIPVLNSAAQFSQHMQHLPNRPYAIQINTGMNRLGMEWSEFRDILPQFATTKPELIMSHLACADEVGHAMNEIQLKAFTEITRSLNIPKSLAATGGILLGDEYHFDLTRPGIGLYGGLPFKQAQSVVRLEIPVIQTRLVRAGGTIGYGAEGSAQVDRKIATLAAGYADGVFRWLGGQSRLWSDDVDCPVVGRISMDLITVDVSKLAEPPQSLELLCEHQSIDDLAADASTIGYEVLTNLGSRYKRVYSESS